MFYEDIVIKFAERRNFLYILRLQLLTSLYVSLLFMLLPSISLKDPLLAQYFPILFEKELILPQSPPRKVQTTRRNHYAFFDQKGSSAYAKTTVAVLISWLLEVDYVATIRNPLSRYLG